MRGRHVVAVCAALAIGALTMAAIAWGGASSRQVQMLDNCDGPSFNEVIGPGTCARNGGLTFDKFLARLLEKGAVESWRSRPRSSLSTQAARSQPSTVAARTTRSRTSRSSVAGASRT